MAKIIGVLYDDPVDGYPKTYARDTIPVIKSYPDGQTTPTPGDRFHARRAPRQRQRRPRPEEMGAKDNGHSSSSRPIRKARIRRSTASCPTRTS